MILSLSEKIPLYSIFVLILIISAGYFTEIFPCKLQRLLKNNIYIKHFFAYLTLIFFVVLTTSVKDEQIYIILYKSFILYLLFLLVIKSDYRFFVTIIFLTGFYYLSILKKYEMINTLSTEKDPIEITKLNTYINYLIYFNNCLFIFIIFIIIIGFLIYLGEKKYEYGNKFNFLTFIFGKLYCSQFEKKISIINALKYSIS